MQPWWLWNWGQPELSFLCFISFTSHLAFLPLISQVFPLQFFSMIYSKVIMMICFPRSGSLPAGYTKCDLKAKNGVPRFQVSNQRAWANPTPTPWGRDSEYHVTASSSDHMLTRGRACHQILFQAHNWVRLHVTLMLHTFSVGFIPISDSDIILFKPKHDRHFINRWIWKSQEKIS